MQSDVIQSEPSAASAPDQAEPVEAAVREVSARVAAPAESRPSTFFSIEEADASPESAPLQVA